MAYFEIRVSKDDLDGDDKAEVLVEFFYQNTATENDPEPPLTMKSSIPIYLNAESGLYDRVGNRADLDGSGGKPDAADDRILVDLANTFNKIDPRSFSQ